MSSAVTLKFKEPISREDFDAFCSKNDIEFSPNTVGGDVYYYRGFGGVQITFRENEIWVSTFHYTCGGDLLPVAYIAKKIRAKFNGTYSCDPELKFYMPKKYYVEEEEDEEYE